jgi:hypothetical protein
LASLQIPGVRRRSWLSVSFVVRPLGHAMRFGRFSFALALAFLLAGCASGPGPQDWHLGSFIYVLHGQVDFVSPPSFEWRFGAYNSVMFFDRSTLIRMGGTYCSIELPYYLKTA